MSLKLYNTRTRGVEQFVPQSPQAVRIYVCGLTPSAQAHIGHARSFLFFDVLRRYLRHLGYAVTYVQNVTDIDDRSIARAKVTGEDWRQIVAGYYADFKTAMRTLDVAEPDHEPRATAFIPQIITMIEELISREYAYISKDGVYYSVSKFARYGDLSHRKIDELQSGARIEIDEYKRDPLDFALWKFAKPDEPAWPSPWGDGRPGWHIECSAMSRELISSRLDIHGGGADLIFPHHENEIAQSEPLMTSPPMANFWVHGGLLLSDRRKISKSLGNFEPLGDLLGRHDPQAIRLLFLQTGYSKVMNFTEESIVAAAASLEKLKAAWRSLLPPGGSEKRPENGVGLLTSIELVLDNDMNTAGALAELHLFASKIDSLSESQRAAAFAEYSQALHILGLEPKPHWRAQPDPELPADFLNRLRNEIGDTLSLNGSTPKDAIELVIAQRARSRANKDFATSDRLRIALQNSGVILNDSKEGTTWTVAD
ncbi:MAG: cysteine--tRNA ligase [Candidatus Eremiobacteraeota bacterium]|nr:cysteine--tRNA ligase [Candidatus Eremiobacteraeota bacterium]